ncbi:hypothetical protein [Burkholderia pyrrocinia]|uniref:hypothetical protein n=1 Tax=Burkholderia pyrrocinia TaxID=60550 RepID=UPI001BCE9E97|nr:hypothetical protein [Burkholderia pyrrocinia]QVN21702.1 hypothetical protein JYG32_20155 [Burkholderia pyrrocinia]
MINYRTPELSAHLFPAPVDADEIEVTEPLSIDPSIEAVGIDFGGTRFIVFFADVMAYAGSDPDYVRQTASAWNNGFVPTAGSRLVKFVRADADADTMFDPAEWPLPDAAMIWQFIEALAAAVFGKNCTLRWLTPWGARCLRANQHGERNKVGDFSIS